jgi:TonB family protein
VRPVQPVELPKQLQRNAYAFDINPPKRLPGVSLKPVVRKAEPTSHSRPQTDAADEQRTQLATAFRDATRSLRDSLSSSTSVEMRGWDGRGVPYANFLDSVKRVYSAAWNVPDGVTDDEATAAVTVTIARDGTVLSAKIIRRSGNALADASVEATLRRVTIAVPLPDGAKEDERTVTIKFNVKAKRGL